MLRYVHLAITCNLSKVNVLFVYLKFSLTADHLIAGTYNSTPKTGVDDIINFFSLVKLSLCWSNLSINQMDNDICYLIGFCPSCHHASTIRRFYAHCESASRIACPLNIGPRIPNDRFSCVLQPSPRTDQYAWP